MARECSSRRPSLVPDASSVADPDASSVPDVSVSDPVAGVDPAMSEDEDDPDYVPSSASEPGSCSGDEEVLRSVPTSVLAARARKRSAPPADESSDDLRDNELSPPSDPGPVSGTPESASAVVSDPVPVPDPVPGTPESASAVVTSDPVPVPDPVPGTPVSASAVVVPDSTPVPKPKKRKPRPPDAAAASVPAESTPVESTPAKSTPVPRPPSRTFWEATRRTGFGFTVNDGTGASVYLDFGRLSRSIEIESTSFEYDRFVKYVHHGVGRIPHRPPPTVYLSAGTPLEFPKPQK